MRQGSCGGTHTLVLTAEGRIFTWGRGSFGRLGTGVEKDCYSPVEVFLPGACADPPWASAVMLILRVRLDSEPEACKLSVWIFPGE